MIDDGSVIKGSIQDVADTRNISISQATMNATRLIALDVSGSMEEPINGTGKRKIDAAYDALVELQTEETPGNSLVYGFSSDVQFAATGFPVFDYGATAMYKMLEKMYEYDDTGMSFVLISDGQPTDASPLKILSLAMEFVTPIQTVFIGTEEDIEGVRLMRRISETTGGKHIKSDVKQLKQSIKLLTSGE